MTFTFPPVPGIGKKPEGYRGRFAPSPSGNLHFGSLITALASYLDARSQSGKWLLRIDDLDTPRVRAGAANDICKTLESHGLLWDETPLYQSQQFSLYEKVIHWLEQADLCYGCCCTRKEIKRLGGQYAGTCRDKGLALVENAVRLKNPKTVTSIEDLHLGQVIPPKAIVFEDFVLRRRDGLFGYHLAAVIDDVQQQVSHVVRGADLLYPSVCQKVLYSLWRHPVPKFIHVPIAATEPGKKLSKQNHSPELDNARAPENVIKALGFLGHCVPDFLKGEGVENILNWAAERWMLNKIPGQQEIIVEKLI